ncbi:hypothetical protein CICLE_v10013322mg [Citrus x clementina]|uniref:Uncharacterized protein n=2 Tax=Citrus TaxID=2706 RepID=A0A067F6V1_CITSI|nr:hypothetical protein CICLE_v10013322mg [Citrus x clementina]KDO63114.1 hypothetical protein CISIN_1g045181mg [Citrus sinensis]
MVNHVRLQQSRLMMWESVIVKIKHKSKNFMIGFCISWTKILMDVRNLKMLLILLFSPVAPSTSPVLFLYSQFIFQYQLWVLL